LALRRLRDEALRLTAFQVSDRSWPQPLAAALSSATPLFVGAAASHPVLGALASLAGLGFLYLPERETARRMPRLLACTTGMGVCLAVGLSARGCPAVAAPVLMLVTFAVTMLCRTFAIGPPGGTFFLMAAAIGAYAPSPSLSVTSQLAAFALGGLWTCAVGWVFAVLVPVKDTENPAPLPTSPLSEYWSAALLIAFFVGLSCALAEKMGLDRPYWVPISCLAVVHAPSLRAAWDRHIHRLLGTVAGLLLALIVLMLPPVPWVLGLSVLVLSFGVEMLIVRHYGLAVVLITPLAIVMAEATAGALVQPDVVMQARLLDTALGCSVGLLGGISLHLLTIARARVPVDPDRD